MQPATPHDPAGRARLMWTLFEPVHAVTYFAPQPRAHFEAAGLRGYWRGYFAGRAAPLGPVGAAPVIAAFFGFAPAMVSRAIPDVWTRADPERTLAARLDGAVAALGQLLAAVPAGVVDEAAELLEHAAGRLEPDGRVLGAANAALPRPAGTPGRLWQAATTLREHRGDGHNAAWVTAGWDGRTALAWRAALDLSRQALQANRGWTDQEWEQARQRLTDRGWLDGGGRPTPAGLDGYRWVERCTDEAAGAPWRELDHSTMDRLIEVLTPVSAACRAALPTGNPIGLPPQLRPAGTPEAAGDGHGAPPAGAADGRLAR